MQPDGTSEVIDEKTYDAVDDVLTDTDLHGNVTTYQYDGLYRS